MAPLTTAQQALLDWIADFIHTRGYAPTHRQMVQGMGLQSPAGIQARLRQLLAKGYLDHTFGQARSLRLVPRHQGLLVQGTIAAGGLVETFPESETLSLGPFLLDPLLFALRVRGDSMIAALIDHNDIVLLRPPTDVQYIKDGTIVAARVAGQTTLKHFYRQGRTVTLQPANANYEPMRLDAKTVEIQGVLVGVLRAL
jgi:repressor LexA